MCSCNTSDLCDKVSCDENKTALHIRRVLKKISLKCFSFLISIFLSLPLHTQTLLLGGSIEDASYWENDLYNKVLLNVVT